MPNYKHKTKRPSETVLYAVDNDQTIDYPYANTLLEFDKIIGVFTGFVLDYNGYVYTC